MPKATDDDIKKVKLANPGTDLHLIEHPVLPIDFIVRGPSKPEWALFRQRNGNDAEKGSAEEMLYETCAIWPEKKERDEVVARYPAVVNMVAGELAEIAGATQQASHRKL